MHEAAFAAEKRAVDRGLLELSGQYFFNVSNDFDGFADFEKRIIGVTHTEHRLSPELQQQVKEKFESYLGPQGACFTMPIRVDLLQCHE